MPSIFLQHPEFKAQQHVGPVVAVVGHKQRARALDLAFMIGETPGFERALSFGEHIHPIEMKDAVRELREAAVATKRTQVIYTLNPFLIDQLSASEILLAYRPRVETQTRTILLRDSPLWKSLTRQDGTGRGSIAPGTYWSHTGEAPFFDGVE